MGPRLRVLESKFDEDETNCVTSRYVSEIVRCRLSTVVYGLVSWML